MPTENVLSQQMILLASKYLASLLLFAGHYCSPAGVTDKTHHDPCPYGIYILVHLTRKSAGWRCRERKKQVCKSCDGGEQIQCDS